MRIQFFQMSNSLKRVFYILLANLKVNDCSFVIISTYFCFSSWHFKNTFPLVNSFVEGLLFEEDPSNFLQVSKRTAPEHQLYEPKSLFLPSPPLHLRGRLLALLIDLTAIFPWLLSSSQVLDCFSPLRPAGGLSSFPILFFDL